MATRHGNAKKLFGSTVTQTSLPEWLVPLVAVMKRHRLEYRQFARGSNLYASNPLLQTKHR
jgi:hypothetical protein